MDLWPRQPQHAGRAVFLEGPSGARNALRATQLLGKCSGPQRGRNFPEKPTLFVVVLYSEWLPVTIFEKVSVTRNLARPANAVAGRACHQREAKHEADSDDSGDVSWRRLHKRPSWTAARGGACSRPA